MRRCANKIVTMFRVATLLAVWMVSLVPSDAWAAPSPLSADESRTRSEKHYRAGLDLFEAGNRAQALIEFQLAYELYESNDIVFMMAQCEYHLGHLSGARAHYQQYLDNHPDDTLAETARLRIDAIDRRPSVFAINSVPGDVQVHIQGENEDLSFTGEAPNQFPVPRGRYRITVSKPNYLDEIREIEIGIAETKSLFFGLRPVPARLIVRTAPRGAALFVRGMRAENPYVQDVEPGDYQIYAEAKEHEPRRDTIRLGPGETREIDFGLQRLERSGRPELIAFWSIAGAIAGGGAVVSLVHPRSLGEPNPASGSLITAAAGVGAVSGLLLANAFTPEYIQDNLALNRIGHMWIGVTEGALIGLAISRTSTAGWLGGTLGLGVGATTGALTDGMAPDYGRVATIQSAAMVGLLAGSLAVPAFNVDRRRAELALLTGVNLGLIGGLAIAHGPDQARPGPSWKRVLMIDLGGLAGAFAGAVATTLSSCRKDSCSFNDTPTTARWTLAGGGLGLLAGWLLTMDFPSETPKSPAPLAGLVPGLGVLPVADGQGRLQMVPAVTAARAF